MPLRTSRNAPLLFGALLGALGPALAGCGDPDLFKPSAVDVGDTRGVIDGTVTYIGPAPCTRDGKILGAAVLLAFEDSLLPPPEGLGTSAASLDVVTGEALFSSIRDKLAFAKDGGTVCGDPGDPVTASATWAVGPFPAGMYQIRGFYDKYGDFDPAFSISNLPTKGDVGGGAIANAAEALAGAPVKYQEFQIGEPDDTGKLVIPPEGVRISGVAVSLGLSLPLERPIFHVAEVLDASTVGNKDPKKITMPADFQLAQFSAANPPATEKSLIRVVLGAGLADTKLKSFGGKTEAELSSASPFFLPNKDLSLLYARQDVNNDGKITSADHVPDSALIPSLLPVAVFTKLASGARIGSQAAPTIVLQGLTIYKDLLTTAGAPANLYAPSDKVTVALRPAVACLDANDPTKPGVLLLTHDKDTKDNLIIADEGSVKAGLEAQFKRPFSIKYGCLPQGEYAMNLLYSTGQAWTVPNEAGVCAASEELGNGGESCGTRPRFASQDVVITIGAPTDKAYCASHATPAECLPVVTQNE